MSSTLLSHLQQESESSGTAADPGDKLRSSLTISLMMKIISEYELAMGKADEVIGQLQPQLAKNHDLANLSLSQKIDQIGQIVKRKSC